jgi:hypothetical protein
VGWVGLLALGAFGLAIAEAGGSAVGGRWGRSATGNGGNSGLSDPSNIVSQIETVWVVGLFRVVFS